MTQGTNISRITLGKQIKISLDKICKKLHLGLIFFTMFLVISSPWLFMARKLMPSSSWVNVSHVYLGLVTAILSVLFLLLHSINGRWRQFFCWLDGDISQLKADLFGLFKGRLPVAGGKGLFTTIEGLGLLALVTTGITGSLWFFYQGTADAMFWRQVHINCAYAFIGYLCVHILCAISHIWTFIKNS